MMIKIDRIKNSSFYLRHNKKISVLGIMFLLYVIQFLFFANMFSYYFSFRYENGISSESIIIYWVTTILVILWGSHVSLNIKDWIIGDLGYVVFICIYSVGGAYGRRLAENGTFLFWLSEVLKDILMLVILQAVILGVIYTIRKIMKRKI